MTHYELLNALLIFSLTSISFFSIFVLFRMEGLQRESDDASKEVFDGIRIGMQPIQYPASLRKSVAWCFSEILKHHERERIIKERLFNGLCDPLDKFRLIQRKRASMATWFRGILFSHSIFICGMLWGLAKPACPAHKTLILCAGITFVLTAVSTGYNAFTSSDEWTWMDQDWAAIKADLGRES